MSATVLHRGRRVKVKTTPAMTLQKVLAEAAGKLRLPVDGAFALRREGASDDLDLSLPLRLLPLPPGMVKLELVAGAAAPAGGAKKVNVALQVEGAGRHQEAVDPGLSLWALLRVFEERKGLLVTARVSEAGRYLQPVINIVGMGEIATVDALAATTLVSLGVSSGSCLVRLRLVESDRTLDEVMASSTVDMAASPAAATASATAPMDTSATESGPGGAQAEAQAAAPAAAPVAAPEPAPVRELPTGRDVKVFVPRAQGPEQAQFDVPDEFFELSKSDFAALQADLAARRKDSERLMTREQREELRRKRLREYDGCLVRVRFSDGLVLQARFQVDERLGELVSLVRQYLAAPDTPFFLYTTPPIAKLDPEQTFAAAGLVPAALVYFGVGDAPQKRRAPVAAPGRTLLVKEVLEGVEELPDAVPMPNVTAEAKVRSASANPAAVDKMLAKIDPKGKSRAVEGGGGGGSGGGAGRAGGSSSGDGGSAAKQVPKWMKLGK